VRFVARRAPGGEPAGRALAALHAADIYLACACSLGDARAASHFERLCAASIAPAVKRLGASAEEVKEVHQWACQHLLAPRADGGGPQPPRVADFSGRGTLGAWVRVVAVRQAVIFLGRQRRELPVEDDELARKLGPDTGPELAYFKGRYRDEFKAAFADALAALSQSERALLRQHALDGLSIDKLAALYNIHRATAARRVEAARRAVLEQTRSSLGRRLRLDPDEIDSVMRLLESRLDLTLSPLLHEPDEAAPAPAPGPPRPSRGKRTP
jgi:RNA polymerase sigma-70 factor (ECF subfamily)